MKMIRLLAVLFAPTLICSGASAQTVVNSTCLGDGSNNFKNGDWNNSSLWSPANVPGTDPNFLWDVAIPYIPTMAQFNGPNLNVDVTVRNLRLVNRAYLDAQPMSAITLKGGGASIQDSLTGLNGLRNLQGIQGGGLTNGAL